MPTPEQVSAAVDGYVRAVEARDRAAFEALWAADAVHHDPPTEAPHTGRDAIVAFFDQITQMVESFSYDVRDVIVVGDEAVMIFTLTLRFAGGPGGASFDAVELFRIDDDGRITYMKAYFDQTKMRPIE